MPISMRTGVVATPRIRPDFTVLLDSAEKKRMPWPVRIEWQLNSRSPAAVINLAYEVVTLAAGDFTIKGYESLVGGERKGSISELTGNFETADKHRQFRAFERLACTVKHPFLFLDFPISEAHPRRHKRDRRSYTTRDGLEGTVIPNMGGIVLTKLACVAALYGFSVVGPLPSTSNVRTKMHMADRYWAADFVLRLMLARIINPLKRQRITVFSTSKQNRKLLVPATLRRLNARATCSAMRSK